MRISIAMATYNGAQYLQEQLESFLCQSRLPDELIVCDDGSTDATLEILEAFRNRAPFAVHIHRNATNLGYTGNFEQALTLCTGDIVFLSDQDDVWLPTKLEDFAERLSADQEVQLLIHDLDFCRADLTPIGQTKLERMEGVFDLDRNYVVGMATAVRRTFLKLCLPFPQDSRMTHDSWLHECAWAVQRKTIVHRVLALYRRHPSSATATGDLNVDFVTTPAHFKSGRPSVLTLVKNKTDPLNTQVSPLCEWLQRNRSELSKRGYTSLERIDELIAEEKRRVLIYTARTELLSMARIKRIKPVVSLLRRGGYRYFSGWKSAAKDLLIN